MKKLQLLGIALAAVCAFSAFAAVTASATVTFLLAEWLTNGNPIPAGTTRGVNTTGELLLENKESTLKVKAMVLCSGVLHGTIGPTGEDEIAELLSLTEVAINLTALVENGLACTNQENCEEPLAWAVHLPWKTLLELMEEGTEVFFVDLVVSGTGGKPGWYVKCMKGFVQLEDECLASETEGKQGLTNLTPEAPNLDAEFSEAFTLLAGASLATCSTSEGRIETGNVEGLGTIALVPAGETLTASE